MLEKKKNKNEMIKRERKEMKIRLKKNKSR